MFQKILKDGAAAAWAQVVVSVVAVLFAYVTFASWRDQELSKLQAQVAGNLTSKVSSFQSILTAFWPEPRRYTIKEMLADGAVLRPIYTNPTYFQFIVQSKELRDYTGVANGILENDELRASLADLLANASSMASCIQHLRSLDAAPMEEKEGRIWQVRTASALAAFSVLPEETSVSPNKIPCDFKLADVSADIERIEKRLISYLRLAPQK